MALALILLAMVRVAVDKAGLDGEHVMPILLALYVIWTATKKADG